MKKFFEGFLNNNKGKILIFSFLRIFAFIQVLFWPYAFSKIINILSENAGEWRIAVFWAGAMIFNKVLENFIRIKAKYELEKLGSRLKISLATFFTEKTRIRNERKTGESVQAIKKASEDIDELICFYKADLLKLPVNMIVIPFMLWRANVDYLILLIIYSAFYLLINHIFQRIYDKRLEIFFKAAEVFWGTTYRKAPEVWRQREDGYAFANQVDQEGSELYKKEIYANKVNMWRWAIIQAFSDAFIGGVILFVIYKIVNNIAPIGTLILVTVYFQEVRTALNIVTSAVNRMNWVKVSLKRLNKAVRIN